MFRRLKALYLKVKSNGFVYASKWLITTLYHRLIPQKQIIWYTDLTEIDSEGFSMPDNVVIQRFYSADQVDKEDLKTLIECGTDLMGSAGSILVRERFNKGAVLWLLKENGRLAGYRWSIINNHVTPTYFPHTETDVHSIGIEIFPGFRGGDLFRLFHEGTKVVLKKEGSKRFYSETHLWNKRAVKAYSKTNSHKIGIATRFSVFGKNVVIWHDMTGKTDFL
jgi:hypothetical protein